MSRSARSSRSAPGASIGARTVVYPNVVVGPGARIGEDCVLHSHVSIRERVVVGNRVVVQNGAVLGSDGFGFVKQADGTHAKIPQHADVVVEDDVEIGANTTIDRPAVGETRIRAGAKIDNLVQIAPRRDDRPACAARRAGRHRRQHDGRRRRRAGGAGGRGRPSAHRRRASWRPRRPASPIRWSRARSCQGIPPSRTATGSSRRPSFGSCRRSGSALRNSSSASPNSRRSSPHAGHLRIVDRARGCRRVPHVCARRPSRRSGSRPFAHRRARRTVVHVALRLPPVGRALSLPSPDERFSWDTHFGGDMDIVDYVGGRVNVLVDYEAMLGSEYRPFDPNQGNYTLEASGSVRARRHGNRRRVPPRVAPPQRPAEAVRGGVQRVRRARAAALRRRPARRWTSGPTARTVVQQSYVDYPWTGRALDLLVRRPINKVAGVFARGDGVAVRHRCRRSGRATDSGAARSRPGCGSTGGLARSSCLPATSGAWTPIRSTCCPMQWGFAGFRFTR